jgi:hypothetical protein
MKFNANIFETNNSNPRICTISINLLSFTTVGQLPKCSLWEPAGRGLNHNTYKDPRSRVGLGKSQYKKKLQLLINFLKESIWFQNTILSQENQMLQLFWCVGGRVVWRCGGSGSVEARRWPDKVAAHLERALEEGGKLMSPAWARCGNGGEATSLTWSYLLWQRDQLLSG